MLEVPEILLLRITGGADLGLRVRLFILMGKPLPCPLIDRDVLTEGNIFSRDAA